jgi:OmpA-OmpF porin, OOP family
MNKNLIAICIATLCILPACGPTTPPTNTKTAATATPADKPQTTGSYPLNTDGYASSKPPAKVAAPEAVKLESLSTMASNTEAAALSESSTLVTLNSEGRPDISRAPVSKKNLGKFPYLEAPAPYNFSSNMPSNGTEIIATTKRNQLDLFAIGGEFVFMTGQFYQAQIWGPKGINIDGAAADAAIEAAILNRGGFRVTTGATPKMVREAKHDEIICNSLLKNSYANLKTYLINTEMGHVWLQTIIGAQFGCISILQRGDILTPK